MPRVALTDEQRIGNAVKDISRAILSELNAERGRARKTNQDFAEELGVSARTWKRWNDGGLDKTELGTVLKLVERAGMKLVVVQK